MTTNENINVIIKKNDEIGRFAVASSDLQPGDLIFSEEPFAFGPKSSSPPLCLGCLSPVDCSVSCSKCSWPVCGPSCENLPVHKDNECAVFAKEAVKFQKVDDYTICLQYECITPLRVLLAKERKPKRWSEEVEVMEAHNDVRKTMPIWEFNQINVVNYLRDVCKLQDSAELIHTVCGILEMNAFEARTPTGYLIRCLYPKLAVLSHNCVSNIVHSIECNATGKESDFKATIRAATVIKKDSELYSSYTYSLWPTLVRQKFLRDSKYFECKCERCKDKTELGTHMSTLKCSKCDNGVLTATDPLSNSCDWTCSHCEFKTTGTAVEKVFAAIEGEIEQAAERPGAEGIEAREAIFRKYRSVLHPKNAYMTILRAELVQLYGNAPGYALNELPDIILERKVELCHQLLDVVNVIEPGHSRIRGVTLYELHAPLMILARNQFNNKVITKDEFRKKMEEAMGILKESADILKNESPYSVEGQLGQAVLQAYETLKNNFEVLMETA